MRQRTYVTAALAVMVGGLLAACSGASGSKVEAGGPAVIPAAAMPAAVTPAVAPVPAAAPVPAQAATGNIVQVAQAAGQFNTLIAAVQAAGLADTLTGAGPFTVFAPTDAAFAKIPQATLDALLADKAALTKVLTYHVLPGKVASSAITNGEESATVEGSDVTFTISGSVVKVNGATVVTADVQATNGVIHVIDAVLLPPDLALPVTQ
jgi:uncharacterized surface protein with fasciclin (FAS1) repeats